MTESRTNIRKVTISLPRHLLEYADRKAAQMGISRSQVLADLLAEMAARERDTLAAEGYRFYAQEAEEFAAASLPASSEAMGSCS
ncbi:MAG: hypothetical protein H5T64_06560 [Chloroflexi bacterium]|nr:hypothetical protein [Chloroflexota bacterium]